MSNSFSSTDRRSMMPLLWIGMTSIAMAFMGLTSGYIVAKGNLEGKGIWQTVEMPSAFYISTVVIVLASALLMYAGRQFKAGQAQALKIWMPVVLLLGLAFLALQYYGWSVMTGNGVWFTGEKSTQSGSWFYVITWFHWVHAGAGVLVLLRMLIRSFTNQYEADDMLRFKAGAQFWHFLGILWVYLLLFLVFLR